MKSCRHVSFTLSNRQLLEGERGWGRERGGEGEEKKGRGRGKRSRKGRREEGVEGKIRDEAEERHGIEEVWNESILGD